MKKPLKQWAKKYCKQCKKSFLTKYDKKVFCNNSCKCEWHNQRERMNIQKWKTEQKETRDGVG